MDNIHQTSAATRHGVITPVTLILAVLLAAAVTAAIVLGVVHVRDNSVAGSSPTSPTMLPQPVATGITPYVQQDKIQPIGESSGVVYFPVPYYSVPSLKLVPADRYLIAQQTEEGFTWIDRDRASATELWGFFKEQADNLYKSRATQPAASNTAPAPPAPQPELAWEAKGVIGDGKLRKKPKIVEQSGSFSTVFGTEGEIYFPEPFALPPNVQLSGAHDATTNVTKVEATNFKWRNAGKDETWGQGSVTWTARGPQGPPENAGK
jgi:hypothetical protein